MWGLMFVKQFISGSHLSNTKLPQFVNKEKQVISGAGDGEVRHLDIASTSVLSAWRCHRYYVDSCFSYGIGIIT